MNATVVFIVRVRVVRCINFVKACCVEIVLGYCFECVKGDSSLLFSSSCPMQFVYIMRNVVFSFNFIPGQSGMLFSYV